MELHPHPNKKFLGSLPRFESLVKDNTMISNFEFCPRFYFYTMVLGYKPQVDEPYLTWGSAIHMFAQVYVDGLREKVGDEIVVKVKSLDFPGAMGEGLRVWKKTYPTDMEPGSSKWDFMTTPRLINSLMELKNEIDSDTRSGKFEYLAVEQYFDLELPSGRRYGGRADRMDKWNRRPWGRDWKSTSQDLKYYERKLNPNRQFTGYTWAEEKLFGEQCNGQLVTVVFNKAPTKKDSSKEKIGPIVKTFVAMRTADEINQWILDTEFWLDQIDACHKNDNWPQNDRQCAFCKFHMVCAASNDESRINILQNKYKLEPWDHTKVEQDE